MAEGWTKDPGAKLDYHFDWIRWLEAGESITTSTFEVTAGLTVENTENVATNTTVWLSGGQRGQAYTITNRVVTSAGRIDERSAILRVRDR
ncbi:hypothetical protein SEA_JFLIX2_2 [Rhodococcus phage Jflix2]|nr:hypothetical protein SEA_JFLIX2_2 [Rhodococcus phage Jflix2]